MAEKNFAVVAHLPAAVEITKRTSQNSLTIEIKDGSKKIGTLVVGRGTVEWWPESNKVNAHRGNWYQFAEVMATLAPKRDRHESETEPPIARNQDGRHAPDASFRSAWSFSSLVRYA